MPPGCAHVRVRSGCSATSQPDEEQIPRTGLFSKQAPNASAFTSHAGLRPHRLQRALDSALTRHASRLNAAPRRRGRHRHGNAQLLVGNHGDAVPGNLVGLVAIGGTDQVHGRPTGESRDVPHSSPDSGHGHVGSHNADDAHHDAGPGETFSAASYSRLAFRYLPV